MTANKLATILILSLAGIALYELYPFLASFITLTRGR